MGDIKKLLSQSFEQWSKHNSSSLGAALAYYGTLSLAPLLTIAVAIAGLAFGKQTVQNRVVGQVSTFVGPSGASAFRQMLGHTKSLEANSAAIAIGLLVLLISASGVFSELRTALNIIWEVKPKQSRWREIVKDKFFSFAMVVGIGFLSYTAWSQGRLCPGSDCGLDLLPWLCCSRRASSSWRYI